MSIDGFDSPLSAGKHKERIAVFGDSIREIERADRFRSVFDRPHPVGAEHRIEISVSEIPEALLGLRSDAQPAVLEFEKAVVKEIEQQIVKHRSGDGRKRTAASHDLERAIGSRPVDLAGELDDLLEQHVKRPAVGREHLALPSRARSATARTIGNSSSDSGRFNWARQAVENAREVIDQINRIPKSWFIFRPNDEIWEVDFGHMRAGYLDGGGRRTNEGFWRIVPLGTISYINDRYDLPIDEHYCRAQEIVSAGSTFAVVSDVQNGDVRIFRPAAVEIATQDVCIPEMAWFSIPVPAKNG